MITTKTTTVVACTLNCRLSSGHLGLITVGDFFSPSTMVWWVCNARNPVLCARVLLIHNVFRLLVHCSNPREIFFIRVFKEVL